MRTMPLLIAACSDRSSGEFWAHSSSRAARALLVAIVAVEGCSVVMVLKLRARLCFLSGGRTTATGGVDRQTDGVLGYGTWYVVLRHTLSAIH